MSANAPIEIVAHGEGWHDVPYIRLDVHQAELDNARKEQAEELPALLAIVGCKTVEELVGKYKGVLAQAVFHLDCGIGNTPEEQEFIDEAKAVLRRWDSAE